MALVGETSLSNEFTVTLFELFPLLHSSTIPPIPPDFEARKRLNCGYTEREGGLLPPGDKVDLARSWLVNCKLESNHRIRESVGAKILPQ